LDGIIESKHVTFEEVLEQFKKEHKDNQGTNEFPLKCLSVANKLYGSWIKAKISSDVVNKIVLTSHPRCKISFFARMNHRIKQDFSFIPKTGLTVEEAFDFLKKNEDEIIKKRPKCIETIRHFNSNTVGTFFLCQGPVYGIKEYDSLVGWDHSHLVKIDGLHRLLSLLYPKKIQYSFVNAYIAINENFAKLL